MTKLSGRQKKKFRRIVNKAIKSGIDLPAMKLPTEFTKQLNGQIKKSQRINHFKSKDFIEKKNCQLLGISPEESMQMFWQWVKKYGYDDEDGPPYIRQFGGKYIKNEKSKYWA
jgi:hypothetical protein